MKQCAESKSFQSSVVLQNNGDITHTPCPDKSNIFVNSFLLRRNSSDYYPYSQTLDILTELSTNEPFAQNMGVDFNINSTPFSTYSGYSNARFTTTYKSPNRAGAVVGLFSNATVMSDAIIHDVQGVRGEVLASAGRVYSGLYGGTFSVRALGGANHGNVADLSLGASLIRNTDVKNYYRLWIKKPELANLTIREGRNYSIYQEGPYGSEFQGYMFLNNANANSSGVDVSPLQIRLAKRQIADAFTVTDSSDTPLFSLSATGQLRIANPTTPSSSREPCAVGTIVWDANNIYVCVAPNNWRKSALSSW